MIDVRQYIYGEQTDIAPALNRIAASQRRGVILVPAGAWTLSAPVTIPAAAGLSLRGEGIDATSLTVTHGGVGITMSAPANSSTAAHYVISDLTLSGSGTGILDVCGTYQQIARVRTSGFAVGIEMRQSECFDIEACDFEMTSANTIGLLFTDAAFCNRASVSRCQFNGSGCTSIGLADNGGICHSVRDCNFNGMRVGIRVAGVQTGLVEACEFESTTQPIEFHADDHMGRPGTGQCGGYVVRNNFFACVGASSAPLTIYSAGCIRFDSSQVAMATVGIAGSQNSPQILTDGQVHGTGQPFTLLG